MNKENARLYIPAVEALADGELQVSYSGDTWYDWRGGECDFCRPPEHFRRKPKPREYWVLITDTGTVWSAYASYSHAKMFEATTGYTLVHVREVEE